MTEYRDRNIDSLKGFLILCVVIGHFVIAQSIFKNELFKYSWTHSAGLLPVVYFHMPLFLAVSQFFASEFSLQYLKKRFLLIYLPYVFWFFLPVLIHQFTALTRYPSHFFINMLYGDWKHIGTILWFLPVLFTANTAFSLFKRFLSSDFKYKNIFYIILILMWCVFFYFIDRIADYHADGFFPFGIDIVVYMFPFCLIMHLIYLNREKVKSINIFIFVGIMFLGKFLIDVTVAVKTHTIFHYRIDLAQMSVPHSIWGYLAMTLLSGAILCFFLKIKEIRILSYIGRYSFPIYVLHIYLIGYLNKLLSILGKYTTYFHNEVFVLVYGWITFIVIFILSIAISKLLMKLSKAFRFIGMAE